MVKIYTKTHCPFSLKAKQLLREKGISFEEIDIAQHPGRRDEMIELADGRTTVPQVFIGGQHVGGCDDLYALEDRGALDPLLDQAQGASP